MIAHWKGISEKYTFHHQTMTSSTILLWRAKKQRLGTKNGPGSTTRCDEMKTYKIIQLD
jgi:hypothetical protein